MQKPKKKGWLTGKSMCGIFMASIAAGAMAGDYFIGTAGDVNLMCPETNGCELDEIDYGQTNVDFGDRSTDANVDRVSFVDHSYGFFDGIDDEIYDGNFRGTESDLDAYIDRVEAEGGVVELDMKYSGGLVGMLSGVFIPVGVAFGAPNSWVRREYFPKMPGLDDLRKEGLDEDEICEVD